MTNQELAERLNLKSPADAIGAMIRGLEKAAAREDFHVVMSSFGNTDGQVCYGCAATCTLMEAAQVEFTPETIHERDKAIGEGVDWYALRRFENCIDDFRAGDPIGLFKFFGLTTPNIPSNWYLRDDNWKRQLPAVKRYLAELVAKQWPCAAVRECGEPQPE